MLFVNVPIGLAAAVIATRLLPEARLSGPRQSFDIAGVLTVTAGLGALVYALVDANSAGWTSPQTLGLVGVAVALLAGFVAIERRSAQPPCRWGSSATPSCGERTC